MSPHDVVLDVQKVCWVSTLCVADSEMKLGSGFKEMGRWMGENTGGGDVVTVTHGQCQQSREPRSCC